MRYNDSRQLPLYIDAAVVEKADKGTLADVDLTPQRRKGRTFAQPDPDPAVARRVAMATVERAIAEGRHKPGNVEDYCTFGRHLCDGIYYQNRGGGQGSAALSYCRCCFKFVRPDKSGADEDVAPAVYIRPERARRYVPELTDLLCVWASVHFRKAFEAYGASDTWEWQARVLASIVRRRATEDGEWLVKLAASPLWGELFDLAPYVRRAGIYPLDPRQSFEDWIVEIRRIEGLYV